MFKSQLLKQTTMATETKANFMQLSWDFDVSDSTTYIPFQIFYIWPSCNSDTCIWGLQWFPDTSDFGITDFTNRASWESFISFQF